MTQEKVLQKAYEDLQWAQKNKELQALYSGEMVVVHDRKVIAHGLDRGDLLEEVAKLGLAREEVVILNMLPAEFEAPPDLTP